MKKKVFSLMMTLLLAFIGVAKADVVTIGEGQSSTYYGPYNALYGYSFVEQVFTADEIGTAGTINAISFNMQSSESQANSVDIFMKNVSRSNFSSNTDWESVTASDMVFSGTVTFHNGWTIITLDTPFVYDGTSNLMIGMHEYTQGYQTRYFYCTSATGMMIGGYNDYTDPNPYDMGSFTGSMAVHNVRPNIQIDITPGSGQGGTPVTVQIGDGTSTTGYVPMYYLYDNSLSTQLFTAAELTAAGAAAGQLTNIGWYSESTYAYNIQNITIWAANVTSTAAPSTSPLGSGMTEVYSGNFQEVVGWNVFTLGGNFVWDGTSNILVMVQMNNGDWGSSIQWAYTVASFTASSYVYRDGTAYNAASETYSMSTTSNRANTQMTFVPQSSDDPDQPTYEPGLHTLAYFDGAGAIEDQEELIDVLKINRPNGAWMEPYHFNLYNDGDASVNVVLIDFLHSNGYFTMAEGTEYPFVVANNGRPGVDLYIKTSEAWNETEAFNSQLCVTTDERSTHLYEIITEPYQPYCPDVWEKAYNLGNVTQGTQWREYMSTLWDGPQGQFELHPNYDMPDFEENIPDGYDAVMKFTVDRAMSLNARVVEGYENGKVALYAADFGGQGGPMADNYYEERPMDGGSGSTPTGGAFEATIGDVNSSSTSTYFPYHTLWRYSLAENLFLAAELQGAGVTTAPMTSLSWDVVSATSTQAQTDIKIWMANVSDAALTTTSHTTTGMTLVYDGTYPVATEGWNEFVFNQGTFAWDGHSNVLIICQRNRGDWQGSISWRCTNPGFLAQTYAYNDNNAYSATSQTYSMYTSSTLRANIKMKSNGGRSEVAITDGSARYMANRSANAVITPVVSNTEAISEYTPNRGNATIILTADDVWGDGSGYQMLFDADHDTYGVYYYDGMGTLAQCSGGESVYAEFEYKLPTNADPSCTTSNMVCASSATIQIPAGMYDVAIANPTPNDRIWVASVQGNVGGRLDDYTFQEGMVYEFHVYYNESTGNDATDVTITANPDDPTPPTPVDPTTPTEFADFSAGPIIENLNVLPGTYYLVASSTDADYEVEINVTDLPCPAPALAVYPPDNAEGIAPTGVVLQWALDPNCTEYRLVFSSTYWPEDNDHHPSTIITEWTNQLATSYALPPLWNNTNYFWRIEQRTNGGEENGGCTTIGNVFGFTTHLNIPMNLQANPEELFEGETTTLTWVGIQDRTYRHYNIYKDGEVIYSTVDTPDPSLNCTYVVPATELEYNMDGYNFYVTALYDEGESAPSNIAQVKVSGYSATNGINGYVFEQDYETPIPGVTVTVTGTDEFGDPHTYEATTNEHGYYEMQVYVGEYTVAIATCPGYQDATPYQNGPTFTVAHEAHHDDMNFMMDEEFNMPGMVCAETVYVPGVEGDTLVHVYWTSPFSASSGPFEVQIGEGTSTTGYFPFYSLYNYSIATALYTAEELTEAGVTSAPMTSLSWYATNSITEAQTGITIWMANVDNTTAPTTSPLATGMTKVYTGSLPANSPIGWTEFTFNEENFAWDGTSNVMILVQRNCGDWTSSIQWQYTGAGFNAMSYLYTDSAPYNVETTTYTMTTSANRPNIIMKGGNRSAAELTRSLHHYNIYRTDCYNDGPYNSDNTEFLATVWVPDTAYFDVSWPQVEPGVYKWGVSAVYQGNRTVDYPWEERESEIMWHTDCAPCIDKDMQTDVTVTVLTNSADSPEGTVVSFTNMNEGEQALHPQPSITLDATGFYAFPTFRKGDYIVTVYLPGYELIEVQESIWGPRDLRYVLREIIYGVKNLYVSRTGWAMWDPETWEDYPIPTGGGSANTIIDFETGNFNQFDFDNTIGSYHWSVVQEGNGGGYCMKSGNAGVGNSTSAIEASVNYTSAGTISFDLWSRGEGSSDTYDWDKSRFYIDGVRVMDYGAHAAWETFTHDVAAGQHTFKWEYKKDGSVNPTGDCFLVDNISFNIGGRSQGDRHLEGFKVMCTSIDGVQIFNHNTPVYRPFCQLTTVDPWSGADMLIEGEHYLIKVATIYSTGESDWCEPVEWVYEPCDHWGPVDEVTAGTTNEGNHIEWVFEHGYNPYAPAGGGQGGGEASSFNEDCDAGMPAGWTNIDADGDGNVWVSSMTPGIYHNSGVDLTGTGHNSSTAYVISGSYANQTYQALTPDNYLVSPEVTLGGTFSFYACAQDASYAAEHFGVAVSTSGGSSASDFTTIQEWTLTAKGVSSMISAGRSGANRAQGNWYLFTADLSAYQGQTGYVAIRHFNCTDQFILNVDDIAMNADRSGDLGLASGGEFYRQYAEDGIMLNFLALDNVDFRAFMLYSLVNDSRFALMAESDYGQFVLTPAFDMNHFMAEFESFYNETEHSFSLLSKHDIMDRMNDWKNGVGSQNFLSITMDVAFGNARVENDQCINSLPFCTSEEITFEAANTSNTATEEGMDDGCIGFSYNPSFYHMRIHTGGPFVIHMEGHDPNSGTNRDIDFCMWGPYTEQEITSGYACTHLTGDKIMDCCYSASYTEDCYLGYPDGQHQHNTGHGTINYHNPEVGEYYVLMITNYSQQPCVINFIKTEGEGETDCEIVTPTADIIGFLITQDGEYDTIVGPDEREYTDFGEFGEHEYCVRPIYPGLAQLPDSNFYFSMGCPVCTSTNGEIVVTCDPGNPIYAEVNDTDDQVRIYWDEQPEPPAPAEGTTFVYDFENSSLDGLTLIDADGDGNNWMLGSVAMSTGYGHNGSTDMILSKSYDNNTGALTPDNYIVFPIATIVEGSTFSFYACGQDASWASEHFGVAVSTDGTNFTTIQEWTMTSKGEKAVRDGRDQGNWYQKTVDLSDYAGEEIYIAIRHFNCTDMFYLDVDDVELSVAAKSVRSEIVGYNIYRSEDGITYELIATVGADVYEYFDAPGAGTYYYQVTAIYDDGCESEPAVSGLNPEENFVMVGVTGVGETSDNVNLFPNPTKGNVTIQAKDMNRITVVTVLGQVVFDTELDQDEYILNMAQFTTGMYMVRIYTDEGVTVKRVTVMK